MLGGQNSNQDPFKMASTMIESLFQRSLEDMVKGLRLQMIGETAYLSKALDEVRKEMKSMDQGTKTVALQKLTYLNMLQGTDMSWAAFQVVEVMSMHKFSYKKLGYLAASQSFNEATDVLLLITNLLRKDFSGKNEHETCLGLECLSRLATSDLARDLLPDLFTMLGSTRALVRKKATAALWRVFTQYPDAIRVAFKRLVESLGDKDPSVVNSAISVLCDLAVNDPKPYLPLAPELYKLLLSSPNNWLCIKLVKILGVLAPLEPRLVKKIAEPICELMRKSDAKSLLLECIQTVTTGLPGHSGAVSLCVDKLKELMAEDDTNLKYLSLRALGNLLPVHPWAVSVNKDAIGACLSHKDPSIQRGALRLVIGMVSESNVIPTVQVLLQYANGIADADSCNEVLSVILSTCSAERYGVIQDFSWYVSVLAEMALIVHCGCGDEIGRQLIDIGFRVESAVGDVFKAGRGLLVDPALLDRVSVHGLLSAAAWIAGEYVTFATDLNELVEALLQPRTKLLLPSVRAVYVHAVFKVFLYTSFKFFGKDLASTSSSMDAGRDHGDGIGATGPRGELVPDYISVPYVGESSTRGSVLESRASLMDEPFSDGAGEGEHWKMEEQGGKQWDVQGVNQAEWQNERVQRDEEETLGITGKSHVEDGSIVVEEQHRPVINLKSTIELMEAHVSELVNCENVEVQERACNLLGLIQLVRDISTLQEDTNRTDSSEAEDLIEQLCALRRVYSVQLTPVSVHAQERVTAPEGLILENLDSLGLIYGNEDAVEATVGREGLPEWEIGKHALFQNKGSPLVQAAESTSLLAQHRQRHQSFYLPTDGKAASDSFSYPPPVVAADPAMELPVSLSTGAVPLLGDSWSRKPSRTKSKVRPVVVKLDDEDDHLKSSVKSKSKKKDLKDEFISTAIMDVLAGTRSAQKPQSIPEGGPEAIVSSRTRQHRSHSSRSSRRDSNRPSSSAVKDGVDGKTSKKLEQTKSSGRHRHQSTALLPSSPDVDDQFLPMRHPLSSV